MREAVSGVVVDDGTAVRPASSARTTGCPVIRVRTSVSDAGLITSIRPRRLSPIPILVTGL